MPYLTTLGDGAIGGGIGKLERAVISVLSGIAFIVLGLVVLLLGVVMWKWSGMTPFHTSAYVAGGAAEFVLGVCLLVRQVLKCIKWPAVSTSQRCVGNAMSCVQFSSLALLFLVWCTTALFLCIAIIMTFMNYGGEAGAIVVASLSLLFELVFGFSVCCWACCAAD